MGVAGRRNVCIFLWRATMLPCWKSLDNRHLIDSKISEKLSLFAPFLRMPFDTFTFLNENFQLKQIMNVKAGWILFNYEIHIRETKNDFIQKNKIDNLKSITLILNFETFLLRSKVGNSIFNFWFISCQSFCFS